METTETTIEELLTLSVTDLKRLGYLVRGATCTGRVSWNSGGREIASICVQTNTAGEFPAVRFMVAFAFTTFTISPASMSSCVTV